MNLFLWERDDDEKERQHIKRIKQKGEEQLYPTVVYCKMSAK